MGQVQEHAMIANACVELRAQHQGESFDLRYSYWQGHHCGASAKPTAHRSEQVTSERLR